MLERYGDAERAALKKRLISAVLAGDEPFAIEPNGDRFRRARVGNASTVASVGCKVGDASCLAGSV